MKKLLVLSLTLIYGPFMQPPVRVMGQNCARPQIMTGPRTSPIPYIENVINTINWWLGLKIDPR